MLVGCFILEAVVFFRMFLMIMSPIQSKQTQTLKQTLKHTMKRQTVMMILCHVVSFVKIIVAHLDIWTGNTMVRGQVQVNLIGNAGVTGLLWTLVSGCCVVFLRWRTWHRIKWMIMMSWVIVLREMRPSLANTEDLEGWGPHEPGLPERPDTPDGPEGSDLECGVPELGDGRLRLEHECRGHWPYDRGCDDCVQSRERTPARRGHKHETPHSLAVAFLSAAGKHWKVLVLLMVHTGMAGTVVCGGDKERDVASVLNEIGVGGLSVEVATWQWGSTEIFGWKRPCSKFSTRLSLEKHFRGKTPGKRHRESCLHYERRDLCQLVGTWTPLQCQDCVGIPPFGISGGDMSIRRTTHTARERLGAPP